MGFRQDTWAKVWEVDRKERFTKVRISISNKDKNTGEYVQTFGGYVSLLGDAHRKAENLQKGDRIYIKSCNVDSKYKDGKTYTDFTIFAYDAGEQVNDNEKTAEKPATEKKATAKPKKKIGLDVIEDEESDNGGGDDDELPF